MSERWVKATFAGATEAVWLDIGKALAIEENIPGGTRIKMPHDPRADTDWLLAMEPPGHFLPPIGNAAEQLTAFVRRLARMEESETVKPSGSAIVAEARRLIDELHEAEVQDWVIRTYSGMRKS